MKNDAEVLKELIRSEQQYFMDKTMERLSKIKDYDRFTQEIFLIANYTEYRKNMYRDHVGKLWYEKLRSIDSEIYSNDEKLSLGGVENKIEYEILNKIDQIIKERDLSLIEAWEEIRKEIECGEYSVMNYFDWLNR